MRATEAWFRSRGPRGAVKPGAAPVRRRKSSRRRKRRGSVRVRGTRGGNRGRLCAADLVLPRVLRSQDGLLFGESSAEASWATLLCRDSGTLEEFNFVQVN